MLWTVKYNSATHAQKEIIKMTTWCFPKLKFSWHLWPLLFLFPPRKTSHTKQPLHVSSGSVMSSQSKGEVRLPRAREENISVRQQSDQMLVVKNSIAVPPVAWRLTWGRLENSAVDDELNMLRFLSSWSYIIHRTVIRSQCHSCH